MNTIWKYNLKKWIYHHCMKCHCSNFHSSSSRFIQKLSSKEIRKIFIEFFKNKYDHIYVPSSSVIPRNDPAMYFINAGMNQFKPIFLGTLNPSSPMSKYKRAVNSQKCIRVGGKHNDLEDVGKDCYHHTFFEMLGNWSFGDYFKVEACKMAWELITQVYKLPPERLYITYFGGDKKLDLLPDLECRDIWLETGVPSDRILPFGAKDNFWDMGLTGPCGPCTEIHYDHIGDKTARDKINLDNPEVIELWNLVFMQYNREANGNLESLPQRHVDTGMGLERLAAALQGTMSNYDTDLFSPIFQTIQKSTGIRPYQSLMGNTDLNGIDTAYRILADHARMFTVAISDGVLPGNSLAGSKLRKVIRKAALYAKTVFHSQPGFVASLAHPIVNILGDAFPEIAHQLKHVIDVVNVEEETFLCQLDKGTKLLNNVINNLKGTSIVPGCALWELYSVHGLPEEIILNVIAERGLKADIAEWKRLMTLDKSGETRVMLPSSFLKLNPILIALLKEKGTKITDDSFKYNYQSNNGKYVFPQLQCNIVSLIQGQEIVDVINNNAECGLILNKTVFYAEAGGQVADKGQIIGKDFKFLVTDVQTFGGYILHIGFLENGTIKNGSEVILQLDEEYRLNCMKNHTATHLLNFVLRQLLSNTSQQGSLVAADKLRFDFSSMNPLNDQEISQIEDIVHQFIKQAIPVRIQDKPFHEAIKSKHLITLTEEIYPDQVKIVSIGPSKENMISQELCCGTHVYNCSEIEFMVITAQKGIRKGIKRITGLTGSYAQEAILQGQELQMDIENLKNNISSQDVVKCLEQMQAINRALFEKTLPLIHLIRLKESAAILESQVKSLEKKMFKVLKAKFSKEVESMKMKDSYTHFQVHSFQTEGDDSMLIKWLRTFNVPIMAFIRAPGAKTVFCRCFVPRDFVTDDFQAENWAASIRSILQGGPGGSKNLDPKIHFVFIGVAVDNIDLASQEAKIFAEKHFSKITSKVQAS